MFDDFTFRKGVVQMLNLLKNLHKEESGQDLIEYALIGLIVALGAIAGMGTWQSRSTRSSPRSQAASPNDWRNCQRLGSRKLRQTS